MATVRPVAAGLAVALLAAAGCSSTNTESAVAPASSAAIVEEEPVAGAAAALVDVALAVPVGDVTVMDVYSTPDAKNLPVIVMLHGTGNDGRSQLQPLAEAVALEGAVVFVAEWPAIQVKPAWPVASDEPFRLQAEAVVCALRQARRTAEEFGGDPDRLTLLGHSGGGLAGLRVALVDEPPWPGIGCDVGISHRPDLFIGLAGDYLGEFQYADWFEEFFDPYDVMLMETGNPELIVRLVHGFADTNVNALSSLTILDHLVDLGYDARLLNLDTRHAELIRPWTPGGRLVVEQVAAILHEQPSAFAELTGSVELEWDGTSCRYRGPSAMEAGEVFSIVTSNRGGSTIRTLIFKVATDMSAAEVIEQNPIGELVPQPAFVGTDVLFRPVAPGEEGEVAWVFVDGGHPWILGCVPAGNTVYLAGSLELALDE